MSIIKAFVIGAAISLGTSAAAFAQQAPSNKDQGHKEMQGQSSGSHTMTQSKLRQSLEKAGFTQVRIVDAQYLVHAQTQDGDPIVMFINPPIASSGQMPASQSGQNQPGKK